MHGHNHLVEINIIKAKKNTLNEANAAHGESPTNDTKNHKAYALCSFNIALKYFTQTVVPTLKANLKWERNGLKLNPHCAWAHQDARLAEEAYNAALDFLAA